MLPRITLPIIQLECKCEFHFELPLRLPVGQCPEVVRIYFKLGISLCVTKKESEREKNPAKSASRVASERGENVSILFSKTVCLSVQFFHKRIIVAAKYEEEKTLPTRIMNHSPKCNRIDVESGCVPRICGTVLGANIV